MKSTAAVKNLLKELRIINKEKIMLRKRFYKNFFMEFVNRILFVFRDKKGEYDTKENAKSVKIAIGNTTYIVSSIFNKDARGDVVNKIKRLIEREAEKYLAEN